MIPSNYISNKEELSYKIVELKQYLADKSVVEYQAYLQRDDADKRKAMDKVISELKLNSEEWIEKERELKELEKKHATMSLAMEILVKMVSTVSAGIMSPEGYGSWVKDYEKFFEV